MHSADPVVACSISSDRENWANLLKGVSFGTLSSGVSATKTLYLQSGGAASDIIIDISIRSLDTASLPSRQGSPISPQTPSLSATGHTCETLRTLVVHTVDPITVKHDVIYRRSTTRKSLPGLADLETFEEEPEGLGGEATIVTAWTCVGPHALKVEGAKLVRQVSLKSLTADVMRLTSYV